jgi:hypothetical protein
MNAKDALLKAQTLCLQDEDGEDVQLVLLPSLEPVLISELESKVGVALPVEWRELLGFCSGVEGCLNQVDFAGREIAFEFEELFPHGLPIASDGFGNFWVLDCSARDKNEAPVYFTCHDAPIILYQSPNLAQFVHELIQMQIPPHKSLVNRGMKTASIMCGEAIRI